METLFRKYFWVFHLVFLALVAWLVAGTANAIALHFLTGDQKAPVATSGGARARDQVRTRNFNIPNEANIFGALREDLSVVDDECKDDSECPTGKCDEGKCVAQDGDIDDSIPVEIANAVKSELRAKLVSTAVFHDATFSVASIIDLNEGRKATSNLYSVNKCIEVKAVDIAQTPVEEEQSDDEDGEENSAPIAHPLQPPCNDLMGVATIKVIEPYRVYFYNRDEKQWEFIELGDEPEGGAKVSRRKPKKKKKKDDDLGKGIKKTGENSYEVEQSEVDKALGNLSSLATQARIVPAFEGGKPVGFKLFSIRPNSLYSKIGVQNGDVIKRINGYEMNSPDKALEIYQKLKDSKNVTVDLKRRGKPMTLEYGIVP